MVTCGMAALMMVGAALAARPQSAGGPVRVELDGVAAFTAEELEQALAARWPADAPDGTLRVVANPDGSIELLWQSRRRVVDLGGDTGPTAARVAALLASDLLLPFAVPTPTLAAAPLPASPPRDIPESRLRLAASYQAWSGAGAGPLLQGADLAAGLDRRHLRLWAGAGYLSGRGSPTFGLTAWPLHLGGGVGSSFGALLANFVMVPYRIDGLVQVSRALVGFGLEAQARVPLGAGFAAEARAGYEVYVNRRVEIWAASHQLFAMPTSAFRFALGLSWGPRP